MVKICPKCGKENSDAAKFCESCGTGLVHVNVSKKSESGSSSGLKGWWNEQSSGIKALSIIGLCCVGLLLIAGISGMMAPDKTTATNTDSNTVSPSDSNTVSPSNTTSAATGGITILSNTGKYDDVGTYHITGEIKNNGPNEAQYVEVVGTGYDSSGNVVSTGTGYASVDNIPTGGTSPFDVMLLNSNNNIVKYTVQVNQ